LKFHGLPQSTYSTNYGRYARTPVPFAPVFGGGNLLNFPPLSNLGGFDFTEQIRNLTWQQNEGESAVVITRESEHWSSFGAGLPSRSIDEGAKPVAQTLLGVLSKVPDSESGVMFGRQKFQNKWARQPVPAPPQHGLGDRRVEFSTLYAKNSYGSTLQVESFVEGVELYEEAAKREMKSRTCNGTWDYDVRNVSTEIPGVSDRTWVFLLKVQVVTSGEVEGEVVFPEENDSATIYFTRPGGEVVQTLHDRVLVDPSVFSDEYNVAILVELEEGASDPATTQQDVTVVANFKFDEFSSYDRSSLKTKFQFMNRLLFGNNDKNIPVNNWIRHILMARNNFSTQWCVPMERTLEISAKSCVGMNRAQRIAFFTAI
ncbi:hypothetical protein HYFRA_00001661, partial [Hymenoscyphus fraxineus]